MKKNKLIFFLILMSAIGCSKKEPQTLLTRWENKYKEDVSFERKLASGENGQCFKSLFTVETLRSEVKELEKKITSKEKVKGSWKHLKLESLPLAQANFLKKYGSSLGDLKDLNSIDYTSCDDVPCIFNKIYGKEDDVAGYVHYLWYLKLGHLLSADNKVPDQKSPIAGVYNGKEFPLKDYLYSDKELFGLWRLTHMLKAPHTTISTLTETQRIPRGESFEGDFDKRTCGLASYAGWIQLNDGCLTVNEGRQDIGYLYQAVTHEINHQIDYLEGRGTSSFYRSEKQDYLELSGFFMKEYVENEKTIRQWAHKPGIKLISNYAGTSPAENFAESIALYRVKGDHAYATISREHFDFISKNYYHNENFKTETLLKSWIKAYEPEIDKSSLKAFVDCNASTSLKKSTFFKTTDFSSKALPGVINCLGASAIEITEDFKARISLQEPEGCGAMTDYTYKGKWDEHIKEHLRMSFDKYLSELEADKEYLARIQNYHSELKDRTIARESYINCYSEKNLEECFNEGTYKGALEKAQNLKFSYEQAQEMAEMYISFHPFQTVEAEVKKSYHTFVSSQQELIGDEANKVWNECLSIKQNDLESPSGNLFLVGSGYIISSMYNCLNSSIPVGIKNSVRTMEVDGHNVQNAKEELILTSVVQPIMLNMLQGIYQTHKDLELKRALEHIENDKGNLRLQLTSDFSWVTNVLSPEKILFECKREGYKLLSFRPLFHLDSELFSEYVESSSCVGISESEAFEVWLNNSKEVFNNKVGSALETKISESGYLRAEQCLKDFPMDTTVNKVRYRKQREACLIDEWPKLEEKILSETMSDPLAIKFQMSKDSFKEKLEANRRRLQLKIIKEKFN